MSSGEAMISLIVSDGLDSGNTVLTRMWTIPAGMAEAFAEAMAGRFGQPVCEELSTVGSLVDLAEHHLAQDGNFLFLDAEERPER